EFKNLLTDAEFNLVASRSAQAAVLKAIKAGETVVDLNNPEGDGGNDGGGNTPSGSGSESGGNEDGGGSLI
ncbi:MAG: DNA-binding protein, partial [Prevotella sp.]|nr:DNA-binding protein [Prevotella sp.]